MKKLLLLVMLLPLVVSAQHGYMFASKDYGVGKYEKIIKDTLCQDCVSDKNGFVPTIYSWVEYDYGEAHPMYFDLVRSYLTHSFPDTIRGWVVTIKPGIEYNGDCYYGEFDLTSTCINKINSFLPFYVERMSISIPGCNEEEQFSIRIWITKEEMKRRIDGAIKKINQ